MAARKGDGGTGAGGSWTIQPDVIVCCDRGTGGESFLTSICDVINSGGYNATSGIIHPSAEYLSVNGKSNVTVFWCVNGVDRDMCQGFVNEYKDGYWHGNGTGDNCNIVVGFLTAGNGVCTLANINNQGLQSAHDAGYASSSLRSQSKGKSPAEILESVDNCGWVAGPDAETLAQEFLKGAGVSTNSNASGTVEIVEGFMTSGRGTSEQVFKPENYEQLQEIPFFEVSVTEEDYEVKTAEFKTHTKIDLTNGRVYVLIQGDTGQFGGIILKRDYDSETRMYTYTCQEYMARVMSNTIYAIYNESKTVYEWILEIMNDVGIPSYGLGNLSDYDNAVDEEYLNAVKEEEKETNAVDEDTDDTTDDDTDKGTNADGTSSETLKTDEEGNVISNPFEKKPRGIYDKQTILDHFRTLLFDYGVHVRLYGDVTGVPIFKAYEKEEWMNTGWYLQPELGWKTNYKQGFDITNVVTQVGVKNIEALKPTGELYTSEDLFGANLAGYFGRMGVIVDNPTAMSGATANESTGEAFEDADGNKYSEDQVIVSHSYPSCRSDTGYNNGTKPEYTVYTKYWYNNCPNCGNDGTLISYNPNVKKGKEEGVIICDREAVQRATVTPTTTDATPTDATGTDTDTTTTDTSDTSSNGVTTVEPCGKEYCGFCGSGDLVEVFRVEQPDENTDENTDTNKDTADSTDNTT